MPFPNERRYRPAALHRRACRLLGVDPEKVRLVGPSEYTALAGRGVARWAARVWLGSTPPMMYVRRDQPLRTYIHELLHILFPSRPHWWIYDAADMLELGGGFYAYGTRKPAESRAKIIRLARASAKRRGLAP